MPESVVQRRHPRAHQLPRLGFHGLQPARYSGLYVWALLILVFGLWVPDTFLSIDTVKSVASDQAITGILALAALIPLAAGGFDLSVAQNLGVSAVVCAALQSKAGASPGVAVVVTVAMGATIGLTNGFFVARVGVNSFIATLGMTSVLVAVSQIVSDQQFVGPVSSSFQSIASHEILGIPILAIYFGVACLLVWWILEHNPVGRRLSATGANEEAARLAGVRTKRFTFWSFVVSGVLASLAGVLLAAKIGSVDPQVGPSYLLPAFAACFLGMTQLKPGRFNVWGTFVALYLLATGVKGLQLAGGQLWITDLFNGVALIGAVSLAVIGERRRAARAATRTIKAAT
jgi:ribose transport system permease protein